MKTSKPLSLMLKRSFTGSMFLFLSISCLSQETRKIKIDNRSRHQTIDNIGTSSAWFTEFIGKYWADSQRADIARWLFSQKFDKDGNPEGIGLSSYRFNIGGGTTELGDSSRIKDFRKRAECFLNADGTYDWSKQRGYVWFLKKAKEYGVGQLIAFSNTPPVSMTQNGLGYKTAKDYTSNLKADKYPAFAQFLSKVLQHFDNIGLHFDYVSPVNEPQWSWYNNDQEGSPWTNAEIHKIVTALDSTLTADKVNAKILLPEAGHLEYLYAKEGLAGKQIQTLFNKKKTSSVNHLKNVLNVVGGHSYYTDDNDTSRIRIRKNVRDSALKYGTAYWQTEYSMLGDGYKENRKGKIAAMDCALFLGKVIHDDLVYGNAKAWQFWNSCEPGSPDFDTRYCLLALQSRDTTFHSGTILPTKMLWALGNYSRFVRPGMTRIEATVQDGLSEEEQAQKVMVSAFEDKTHITMVLLNYTEQPQTMLLPDIAVHGLLKTFKYYLTDNKHNLQYSAGKNVEKGFRLTPRSITTIVLVKKQ
ncbi:MAG: glycoside hydrolase [Chitinophagaceae bacterium]